MKLSELLSGTGIQVSGSAAALNVTGVTQDSRQVKKGDLFVAVPGTRADGAQFIGEALKAGAAAVVGEKVGGLSVPSFPVEDARKALAIIAGNLYGNPARELVLLGVTGTNGKTTTAYLLDALCSAGGASVGVIGTIGYRYAGKTVEATHTTPDPLALHKLLRDMVDAGTDTVVMEVSSHALSQQRVAGLTFRGAAFTNLTRDHLDFHKDLEEYFQAKRRLFTELLSPGGMAVVNGDDTYAARIYSELRGQKRMAWKFSRSGHGEVSATQVEYSLAGIKATLKTPAGDVPIKSGLVGPHNLENILAAVGIALGAGFARRDIQEGLARMNRVPGRMDRVEHKGVVALIDYAHTDDALRRALEAARTLTRGRVIAIFGCGGDRDQGKRPLMGQVAAEGADLAIVTSDNPRSEDPEEIISQVVPGLEKGGARRISPGKAKAGENGYLVEADRRAAIELGAQLAKPGDVILVAGKGHEAYQQVGAEKRPFDDREEAERALNAL